MLCSVRERLEIPKAYSTVQSRRTPDAGFFVFKTRSRLKITFSLALSRVSGWAAPLTCFGLCLLACAKQEGGHLTRAGRDTRRGMAAALDGAWMWGIESPVPRRASPTAHQLARRQGTLSTPTQCLWLAPCMAAWRRHAVLQPAPNISSACMSSLPPLASHGFIFIYASHLCCGKTCPASA
jgi:hypothetical protein